LADAARSIELNITDKDKPQTRAGGGLGCVGAWSIASANVMELEHRPSHNVGGAAQAATSNIARCRGDPCGRPVAGCGEGATI